MAGTHLEIVSVHDGFVTCGGRFPTADGKGMHALLRPRVAMHEVQWERAPKVGDSLEAEADGTYRHVPRN